ncbi:MAG: arginase [Bryobacterales bacterium]|nr:arginase [Bryobacterales bacterium]
MALNQISIVGVPMDLGGGRRGVDMGPSAIRVANLGARLRDLGYEVEDLGNIGVAQPESIDQHTPDARFLPEIQEACARLSDRVFEILEKGRMPLVLGGDHSIAMGSIGGAARFYEQQGKKIGLIWIDAHADMNTPETTPSGNVHGMPLASVIGLGSEELRAIGGGPSPKIHPKNVAIVGLRSVDAKERYNVRKSGVTSFTMRDIDERGMRSVMDEAIRIAGNGAEGIHVSLDLDAVDPSEAPGVGTPVKGGLSYREAHLALEMVADSRKLISIDCVEVNPVIDEANRTASLAVEFLCSGLGKRIL